MDKFFKLRENGTRVRTEIVAGLTTFVTMAYIIFVNPSILALTGMEQSAVFAATCISAFIGTIIMGLVANVPFAQAAGMGMNSFFVTIVLTGFAGGTVKISWQQALAIVFICGIINIIITVTRVRRMLINAVPLNLQYAISAGIGLFIAFIGFKSAGIIADHDINLVALGDLSSPTTLMAIAGIVIIAVLMLLKIKGAMLIGILGVTLLSVIFGMNPIPQGFSPISAPPSMMPTFFQLDIVGLFKTLPIFTVLALILSFSLSDTFDTLGTFIGTGRKTGIFKDEDMKYSGKGMKTKLDKALFADATATSIGAVLGTSNVTTYIESASGISEGGKTGLTSVVVSIMFILSLFIAPVVGIVPGYATAPALVIVGVLMMSSVGKINFEDFAEALPAFFTVIMMPLTGSIADGIAFGFIFYSLVKIVRGRYKEVHPLMYIFALLFILSFIANA
ncbi:AGZA family xanthine/uracil permease-like MFS transporter [Anaerobacterium chartisolvens]|uniref:AGZA family xanthine/uracil permease-like MFS transporter n=1 Tax=Anaerobacterium chartisolvens TaxID=1297424 RepID=A0A369B607_9FIRM|nr:NCS2 family permease [Anaerobacterium chartisolvens]RCX16933.1 AGZA family xanthine/uracil permease-like MFS transporter [Anaerobacterium chartisolvens]